MKKLNFLVCENYFPEFEHIVKQERLNDINIISFSTFCDGGFPTKNIGHSPKFSDISPPNSILFCGQSCSAPRKALNGENWLEIIESPYCYSGLIADQFCRFFAMEGYYVLSLGWLRDWEYHLKQQGFNQTNARTYYNSWCRKLLFLDSGIDTTATAKLNELSAYLAIPNQSLPVSLDPVRALLKEKLYSWKLKNTFPNINKDKQIKKIQEDNARNAAVLHIISRIASAGYKRNVVSMLKEFWLLIFGATKTHFWAHTDPTSETPDHIQNLDVPMGRAFVIDKETMTLYAPLEFGEHNYGIFEAGGFLFPNNIEKYTDLFDSVIKIAALAISNAQRYEDLLASRNEYEYSSYHDGLTKLYNRAYYNKLCSTLSPFHPGGVFAIDIDGLKKINDTRGHSSGDVLIQTAADTLKKTFRGSDDIIRMGGDEFTVIIKYCDEEQAKTLLQRLQDNTSKADITEGGKLSMSFGYAITKNQEDSLEKMVHQADCRMYESKRKKKEDNGLQ